MARVARLLIPIFAGSLTAICIGLWLSYFLNGQQGYLRGMLFITIAFTSVSLFIITPYRVMKGRGIEYYVISAINLILIVASFWFLYA